MWESGQLQHGVEAGQGALTMLAGVAELWRSCIWGLKREDHNQWLELHEQHSIVKGECEGGALTV